MGNIRLHLGANERLFINGAVLRTDRKVSVELLNDATFLLENHVLQKDMATTPIRQMYFVAQLLLMDPASSENSIEVFRSIVTGTLEKMEYQQLANAVKDVDVDVSSGKVFSALKKLRELVSIRGRVTQMAFGGTFDFKLIGIFTGYNTIQKETLTMPSINQISPALNVAGNSSATSLGTQTVDYDAFLSLLVAQLKNQDPTAPSDQGEFIAQLASFFQRRATNSGQ